MTREANFPIGEAGLPTIWVKTVRWTDGLPLPIVGGCNSVPLHDNPGGIYRDKPGEVGREYQDNPGVV